MAAKKILIADDESRMRKLIKDYLRRDGFEVIEANDGLEALAQFDLNPDTALIIMDVMMPKLDGYGALKKIREKSQVPVIILTAKSEEDDALEGFNAGADEFVTKPFSPKVLVARVKAIINRDEGGSSTATTGDGTITCGKITLDENAHTVTADGENVTLSVKEFDLLEYFMRNKGLALSREKILNSVWDYDYFGDARTIDTHVKKLRSKLGDCGNYIHTIWGMGYKFEVEDN
ncbi:MAG: DNA-binding response regulator [Lachnospiraceae bacterium]|uniref:Stage 0 sporulation protein A homolog n=1 Tax=Candidatus Weimeria bifida TaxID=2599074 RepID=A0A6N7IWB7_9FIRM|nr:response regulator transcription factor [Candidatus Weimeria bifida]RRF96090.1 MAG: DNA-binding response regulator [Lachnospiraceae bacterium]